LFQDRPNFAAADKAREKRRRDKKNNANFFRAVRYLWPYRGIVAISVVAAFFVGLAATGGLAPILPIVRVLLEHDTVPAWVDRSIVNQRINAKLNDVDPQAPILQLSRVSSSGTAHTAYDAGLGKNDFLRVGDTPGPELLHELADPSLSSIRLTNPDRILKLEKEPVYMIWGRQGAAKLPPNPVQTIAIIFGLLALVALIGNVIRFFQEYLSNKAAILAVNDIRNQLYDHVLRVPMGHFSERGTSDATSRLVQDCSALTDGFKQIIGQTIQEPIKVVMGLSVALWADWELTCFILIFAPIMGLAVRKFGKKMYRASKKQLEKSATMLGQLEATLIGIRVVKASAAERLERRRYATIMDGLVYQQLRMSRIDAFNTPTVEMILLVAGGCVVIFGAYLVLTKETLTPENFIIVMAALATMTESLRRISKVSTALQQSNAAAARIFEVLDLPVEQDRHHRGALAKLQPFQNEIRFEDVTFYYPNSQHAAVSNVSLSVPKGRCVAIVGRNGSGKTTVMNLLPRFYDPRSGRILIDGLDIREATLRSLRRQISVVTQDSIIFPGTIAENIAYGHPLSAQLAVKRTPKTEKLRQDIEAAAKQAFAHDFIMQKLNGYESPLGELGGQLSGGQKQRICIARAMLRDSPILILDEATSQVDAESEQLIQRAIDVLMHQGRRTTFVIAHRLSTIRGADEIIVMDQGRIVGRGRHEELMESCLTYRQLYERQV
jgi:subfamily B ATP-binding cassette protein MsbA